MQENEIILTPQIVKSLVSGQYLNKTICVDMASKLKTHALGIYPKWLIDCRRPSESEEIKNYRAKIYVPITKEPISKVISSLEKIRRSQDWNIQFNAASFPKKIADSETLEQYCEYKYPRFTSLTNWAFSVLLRQYLLDANGIVAIFPEKFPQQADEYLKPVATFFESEQIVDYVEDEYIVLLSKDKSVFYTHNGTRRRTDGAIYYIITKNQFAKYEQLTKDTFGISNIYDHNIGKLPAFRVGGIFKSRINNEDIFESRISSMTPSLDEAAREYSDLQAEILQHIHSEKYAYTNSECPVCHGTGNVIAGTDENGDPITHVCSHCNGSGSVLNTSPYGVHLIDAAKAGEQQLPAPPIGYVQKSDGIARLQDERITKHIYKSLSAVNMEFLAETPLSQSGVAKEIDRDELNNFVNSIAEDIVRILDSIYWFINEYRYSEIEPNKEVREQMLPAINVPTKYNILNASAVVTELKAAKDANVSPMIIRELEIDYAKKQFNTQPEIACKVETAFSLDPLFGVSAEDKMVMLQNGGVTETDYIISCNINAFIIRAFAEHDGFESLDRKSQINIMRGYAEEIQKENEPVKTDDILSKIEPTNEPEE